MKIKARNETIFILSLAVTREIEGNKFQIDIHFVKYVFASVVRTLSLLRKHLFGLPLELVAVVVIASPTFMLLIVCVHATSGDYSKPTLKKVHQPYKIDGGAQCIASELIT